MSEKKASVKTEERIIMSARKEERTSKSERAGKQVKSSRE